MVGKVEELVKQRCLGIIPAHNESRTVGRVVSEVRSDLTMDVVVIDDCSEDDTAKVARDAGALVMSLATHSGAWTAMQTGFIFARRRGYEYVITFDADGQHPLKSIESVRDTLYEGDVDVVIGSCPERGSLLRQMAWSFFRTVSPFSLKDLTSGLRGYNYKALSVVVSSGSYLLDYQDMGILLLLHRSGLRIGEIPVHMVPREHGHSRVFNTWSTVLRYLYTTSLLCLSKYRH